MRRSVLALSIAAALASVPALAQQGDDTDLLRIGAVDSGLPLSANPYRSFLSGLVDLRPRVFDTLTAVSEDGTIEDRLATSVEADANGVWTVTLRDGVVFSDGTPLDAANIARLLTWLTEPASQAFVVRQEAAGILSAEATGPLTVRVETKQPDPMFARRLALIPVVPMERFLRLGPDGFAQDPAGTGPYRFDNPGELAFQSVAAVDTSWRGLPETPRIEMTLLADPSTRAQAVMSRQVDIAVNLNFTEREIMERRGVTLAFRKLAVISSIAFSNRDPDSPLADRRVREALNLAVNKDIIAEVLLAGLVEPVGQGALPGVVGYNPDIAAYPYDPDRAKALLAEAGYPDGFKFTAQVLLGAAPEDAAIYQQVASDLSQIGVELELRSSPGGEWIEMWFTGDWRGNDAIYATWNAQRYMDVSHGLTSFSCLNPVRFFCDEPLAERLAAANRNLDQAARAEELRALAAEMHRLAPTLLLFPITQNIGYSPEVENIVFKNNRLLLERVRVIRSP